jgi:hypothetical protein
MVDRIILQGADAKTVRTAVRNANLITYSLMALCLFILLVKRVLTL